MFPVRTWQPSHNPTVHTKIYCAICYLCCSYCSRCVCTQNMSWQHLRCCNSKEWQHACQITLWDKTLADRGLRFILFSLNVFIGTPVPFLKIKGSTPTQRSMLLEDSSVNDPGNKDIYWWTFEDLKGLSHELSSNFSKIIFCLKLLMKIFLML